MLHADLSSDEEKKLQEWLGAPDCSSNYAAALNKRVDGTGKWIFEDPTYLEWKKEGSILWIQGQAGSGKTFLITSIIENLQETAISTLTIYHYFDTRDNTEAKTSFQGLLSSFLSQLGVQHQKIHPELKNLHEASKSGLSNSKPTNKKLEDTLIKILKELVSKKFQVYMMIDALDECNEMAKVWNFCMQMADLHIGIIITSRNDQPAESSRYFAISLWKNSMVDKDIATFLNKEVSFKNTALNDEVTSTLMHKANGGFRYIDCQIQILKGSANAKRVHKVLAELPSSLKGIYYNAIEKITNSTYSEEAHHLLLWLLYSFEPLDMSQVAIILSIDLDSRDIESDAEMLVGLEEIIDTTLVTVDNKNIVQLSHASVKEFLLESNSSSQDKKLININAELAHDIIAQMCLIYLLNQHEEKNIWANSEYMWRIDIETFEQYATQYWGEHSHYIDKNSCSYNKSIEMILIFLEQASKAFINWTKNFRTWNKRRSTMEHIFIEDNKLHVTAWFGLETSAQKLLTNTDIDINKMSRYSGTALQTAAARGHKDSVKLLVQMGAKINAQGGDYATVLQAVATWGYQDTVEFLVQKGAEINTQDWDYGTALHAAAAGGHKDIVKFLVKQGAKMNAQCGNHGTALQAAAARGHKDIVEFLVQQGAEINAQGGDDATTLQEIATWGFEDIMEFLVQQSAEINAQGGHYSTALQAAAARGHKDIVEFLLQQGADINAQYGNHGTALQAAAARGQKDIVKFLLQRGAAINAQGGYYGTALQAAAKDGHKEIVKFLLQQGAEINAQGGDYGTALQGAAAGGHKETVKVLVQQGAEINAQGGYFGTALQAAAFSGSIDMVKFFLQQGGEINAQSGKYGTALQAATYNGYKNIVKFLLQQGAEINAQCGHYGTALQAAAARGPQDIVEFLVQQGAEINAQGGEYGTALQAAAAEGYKDIVEFLLQKGAEINAQGGKYGTAPKAAAARGHQDIVEFLLQQGAEINTQGRDYGTALHATGVSLKQGWLTPPHN
ncbi:ankyrin repeat-containing domain protein [Lentinula raphanica]|nr:ankyrin repeat-containing domain protein [Lentinula raphanica]